MHCVLGTYRTEFRQFNTVWIVSSILTGDVITALTVATRESNLGSNIGSFFRHERLLALFGAAYAAVCVAEAGFEPATQRL
jgi:uncharacterized membrane protein